MIAGDHRPMIAAGQMAPEFELPVTEQGAAPEAAGLATLNLASLRGSWVVLYFYPRDSTPACTLEGQDFSALLPEFAKLGAKVFGLSKDSSKKHEGFCRKAGLTVPLLSDAESDVSERYGVWQEKQMAGRRYMGIVRTTILIDPSGKVRQVWSPVRTPGHAAAVLAALKEQL